MKKYIVFIASAILNMSGYAFDFEKDGIYYNITSLQELTVEVTKGDTPYNGDLVVPNEVEYSNKTFVITRLGDNAFESSTITTISLPRSVVEIGHYVFQYCSKLKTFTIPSQVGYMGVGCFNGCSGLREIIYEDSEDYFSSPYNSGTSGRRAYYVSCPLQTVYIGRNINQGGYEYNDGAFYHKTELTNLTFGNKVTRVYGSYLFYQCTGLKSIYFPENVQEISDYVFVKCSGLESVGFNEGLISIGTNAFEGCSSIKSLLFPSSLESIATGAFQDCTSITQVYCKAMTPPNIQELSFPGIVYLNATLTVPTGTKALYSESLGWKDFSSIIETDNFEEVKYFNVDFFVSQGGSVNFDGKHFSHPSGSTSIKAGEDVTLSIIPDDGYILKSLEINGINVTTEIIDGEYVLSNIDKDYIISVQFEEIPIYLTFKHADNGSIKQLVTKGTSITIAIIPENQWKINTVTFNGKDVTSELTIDSQYTTPAIFENSDLFVTFESTQSSVPTTRMSDVKVYASNGQIIVTGLTKGEIISIYNEKGIMINQRYASGVHQSINIGIQGVYIVKTLYKTVKVNL